MSALGDATDVGLMLAWASQPRETPARHEDYHRVVARYRNDPDFAAMVDAFFSGASLNLIVDERDGAMVTAYTSSPLRVTAGDIIKRAQTYRRAVTGGVLLAVARTAYPEPSMVDDPDRMAVFTTQAVVDTLDRAAEVHAGAGDADGDIDDDELEVWRVAALCEDSELYRLVNNLGAGMDDPGAARTRGGDKPDD